MILLACGTRIAWTFSEGVMVENLPLSGFALLCAGVLLAAGAAIGGEPSIRHSDVVFMGPKTKDICETYGATVVSWGSRAWADNEKAIAQYRDGVKMAHDLGIRYCAGAAFRTAFAGMMDFDANWRDSLCLTIEGQPITIPWLWDQKHKKTGEPAYWFCTNAPGYRKFLKWQVEMGMKADVEGLHIDDYGGTSGTEWSGCCFCKYCMAAFRDYLKRNVPADRLKQCGVESLDAFDYKAFLNGKGIKTIADFRRILGSSEHLGPDFKRFLYFSAAEFVDEAHKYGEKLVGHPLMLSVNSSCSGPESLVIAPYITYFCGEVGHKAEKSPWGPRQNQDLGPVWTFKLADAIGRFQACTGSGGDWAYAEANKKPGLVRVWVAQDFAFGHCLMAPHRQWAYTKEKGTHYYQSQPEDFAHVYRFVRCNAALFDDYDAVGAIALLYSSAGARANRRPMQEACLYLAKNSVPFEMVLAGDDWLDVKLTPEKLGKYKALVVCEPTQLEGEQRKAVDDFTAAGKVVKWDEKAGLDEAALQKLLPKQIAIEGAENVIAVARAIPGKPDAPAILHLLNRNYDEPTDSIKKLSNFTVKLDKGLFGGAAFTKAALYAPPATLDRRNPGASEPTPLKIEPSDTGIVLTIPQLDLWGIVKLER